MATNIMIRSGTTFGLVNFAGNLPGFLTPILNSALIKVIFTHNCCRLNSAYRMIIVCKTRYMSIMPNDPTRLYIWPHDQGHDHDHEELSTAWGHFWWILAGQVNHVYRMVDGQLLSYKRLMFIWWSSYITTWSTLILIVPQACTFLARWSLHCLLVGKFSHSTLSLSTKVLEGVDSISM